MRAPVTIRLESPDDIPAIRLVNELAFGRPNEANIVDALRANGKAVLSLVAEVEGSIVGHVLFSPARFEPPKAEIHCLALGPLAVQPDYQRKGLGSLLVRESLARCEQLHVDSIVLLGNPAYYSRFGFVPAVERGISPPPGSPARVLRAFQIVELSEALLGQTPLTAFEAEEFDLYG
jgi:putative acetyltransferase